MNASEVADQLDAKRNGSGWMARCPAHDDRNPSLSIGEGDDGRTLLCCHAGCDTEAVLTAAGLTAADLFAEDRPAKQQPRRIIATYDYTDANSELLYQVVRYDPKGFRQRRPDGHGGWTWNRGDTPRTLYRLPELRAAVEVGHRVFIVEGEKDADVIMREWESCAATCGPEGAGKWEYVAEIAREELADAWVTVIADKDTAGYRHAAQVVASLGGVAAEVELLEAAIGKDAAEHIGAGKGYEDLRPAAAATITDTDIETVEEARDAVVATAVTVHPRRAGEWLFEETDERPAIWGRDDEILWPDDEGLIAPGPTGVGKTTLAALMVQASIGLGSGEVLGYPVTECDRVLYFAMDRPAQIRRAMRRVFTVEDAAHLDERLVIRPGPLPADLGKHPDLLVSIAAEVGANRLFIDSVKDCISKVSDDESGGNFNRAIQMCNAEHIPTFALHHQRKGAEGAKPNKLEDVYGSTWIVAGAGSVVLLWGEAGTGSAELIHLKTPSTPVGPIQVELDTFAGTMATVSHWDPLAWLRNRGDAGGTVPEAAQAMANKAPSKAEKERARRKLDSLVNRGLAVKIGGTERVESPRYKVMEVGL